MRLIGYVRVSTDEQAADGASLDAQRRRLASYCDAIGAELVDVVADEGLSAKTLDRAGLARALACIESGAADGLVVAKLDRLTRSTRDLLAIVELFRERNHALVSVAERIDTDSASGRLMLTVLGAMATWERETIGERTREVLAALRAQGVKMGGAPFGYRYSGPGTLAPVPEQLATVARMRELRARGESFRAIAARLTAESRPTAKGGRWGPKVVRAILSRPAA